MFRQVGDHVLCQVGDHVPSGWRPCSVRLATMFYPWKPYQHGVSEVAKGKVESFYILKTKNKIEFK